MNLRVKTFVGTSANALHQVWTALIAPLLLNTSDERGSAGRRRIWWRCCG
jgi:hypothetical protein